MTGSLQIKKDKYYMVLNTVDTNGKRKPKWISTGLVAKGNKKRAEQMLRETLREHERRHSEPRAEMLFSDWIKVWLEEAKKRVDIVTYDVYERTARTHILPYFEQEGVVLADVTRSVLQTFVDTKYKSGRKDGNGGLAPKSIRHFRNILNQALKAGVRNGLIKTNPCDGLILPQVERYDYKFYNAEQLQSLCDTLKSEPLYPLIRIASVYGMRRSELLGLKWDCIDFGGNMLTVRHTVVQSKTVVRKDKTKNSTSYRSFPLTPDICELLQTLRTTESKNRILFGNTYTENQYIFKWDDGRPYAPEYVTAKFRKLLVKYDLPHIRFHELRHSCASLLIAQGFSLKDVQEWLGHANIQMTANVYSHLDIARKQTIANSISGAISASR